MNILMIGNGFDLEHDLPTNYIDFLKFTKEFETAYSSANSSPKCLDNIKDEYLKSIFENCEFEDRVNALHAFIENNLWIKYFEEVIKEHLATKEKWIDFESEIKSVIQSLDELIEYYDSVQAGGSENEKLENNYKSKLNKIFRYKIGNQETAKSNISILLKDLNRLTGALEIYIWDYIGKKEIKYYNPDIVKIKPDKIISFNYSDTYGVLYDYNRKKDKDKYSFVHGMADNNIHFFPKKKNLPKEEIERCIQINAESSNIVLGIDEYLLDDRKSKKTDFIAFKKYYQRIYKKTGNEYKKWLKQIDKNVESGRNEENILHIFGHSLDVTDGDILREIINHKNIKTVIYYRDKKQLGQQIANLVKVFKSDEVIDKVYGLKPSISFSLQSKRVLISGSAFEIVSDTLHMEMVYGWSHFDAKNLIEKINDRIQKKDLKYFYSQKSIITLFNALQKNGLARLYAKHLLEIAYELIKCEGLQEPEQYDAENWSYGEYDNSFGCDRLTQEFINAVNVFNKKNFIADTSLIPSNDEQLAEWQKLIDNREKIDKTGYVSIISAIFYMFQEHIEIDNLWNMLLKISRGPAEKVAKDTLKELIKLSDDELDIIRYNHLLSEIVFSEYLDMQAEEFEDNYANEQRVTF